MVDKKREHWDNIFKTKDYTQVLWHQYSPNFSLELMQKYKIKKEMSIIDVGCGASLLVDNLLLAEYKNITLLDSSATSLEIVKKRLGEKSYMPEYICSDIMNFSSSKEFDFWHDRAVFHFLLLPKERAKYFKVLKESLKSGGTAIINTFAVGGPTQCAGLDIVQYNKEKMLEELPKILKLTEYGEYQHDTPKETKQKYSYFILTKSR